MLKYISNKLEFLMSYTEHASTYTLIVNEHAAWLQGNMRFGNMVEGLSEDWQENRAQAATILGKYATAKQTVRMKPKGVSGFVDLDAEPIADTVNTDGLITGNPNLILHANPADCGEVALYGFGTEAEGPVAALLHANRKIVSQGGHLRALEYLCVSRGIEPTDLRGFVSPSVRAASYKMRYLGEDFKPANNWEPYVWQAEDNMWHIDLHGRLMAELENFGIPITNLTVSDIDTAAHSDYYSHTNYQAGLKPCGANGMMFALR
jgi:copper oxidase (laccase) domain-containing protein